ncbi:MAG TPA: ATP-binding protein [Polyangiaceae bacterium]
MVSGASGRTKRVEYDAAALLHELEVHRHELETQNEELRVARVEVESGLERYAELFDFAPMAYVILGRDEAIREINHAGAALFGKARGLLVGQPLAALTASSDRAALRALLTRVLEHETVGAEIREIYEVVLQRPAGRFQASLTVTALGRGRSRVALIALEDVTQRRAEEARRVDAENALRTANARKDEFMAMLAHELRNPLGPMRSGLFVLQRAAPGSAKARHAQEVLERQLVHLSRLLDDLLDVSRIARGKIVLQRSPVELRALVRRTLDDLRPGFESSGIHLVPPPGDDELWVEVDAVRIVQMMSNLLGNAEKFTPRGGTVTVSLVPKRHAAVLRVRDTGVGVAAQELPSLFEPFTQAPQTVDRSRGGLGLGLAMSKGLVELHGGTIALHSDGRGSGAEVVVTLPLISAPARASAVKPAISPSGKRVLVIEDNDDAAVTLKDALGELGYDVRIASDGSAGIEMAQEFHPDVVLCDIGLPGIDGYEVARALRRDSSFDATFLVALSGYARSADIECSRRAGFDVHLAKPADLEQVERMIEAAVRPT